MCGTRYEIRMETFPQHQGFPGVGKCPNFSHHPAIGDLISNRYLKQMFNKSPKTGHLSQPLNFCMFLHPARTFMEFFVASDSLRFPETSRQDPMRFECQIISKSWPRLGLRTPGTCWGGNWWYSMESKDRLRNGQLLKGQVIGCHWCQSPIVATHSSHPGGGCRTFFWCSAWSFRTVRPCLSVAASTSESCEDQLSTNGHVLTSTRRTRQSVINNRLASQTLPLVIPLYLPERGFARGSEGN